MHKSVKPVVNHAKKVHKTAKSAWGNEKLLGFIALGLLVAIFASLIAYNALSKAVQLEQISAARVDIQELAESLNELTDIRGSEIGQKDTLPKTVYEELVLIQADPPIMAPLPRAWATRLMTIGASELDDISIKYTYQAYEELPKDYLAVTGEYLQLIVTLQATIEYNFLSDFAEATPLLPLFVTKIEANKKIIQETLDRVNNLQIEDSDIVAIITGELESIIAAYDGFAEDKDIEATDTAINEAQRNIINTLGDYWDEKAQTLLDDMNVLNADLAIIELALK